MSCEGWGTGDRCKAYGTFQGKQIELIGVVEEVDHEKHRLLINTETPHLVEGQYHRQFWVNAHNATKQ